MLDFIRPQKHFPLAVTRHALRGGAALRVAHLTDLHLEDGADAAWLRRLVRVVNAQRPDIICFRCPDMIGQQDLIEAVKR